MMSTSTGTRASACDVFPRASVRYLICCTRRTAFARQLRVRFPRARDGHDGDTLRDIGVVRGAQHAQYARSSACVSIGTRRDVSAGAFPALASLGIADRARRVPLRNRFAAHLTSPSTSIDRHVVLPPDIAKLLPKGRLLSEVRFRTAIRLDAAALPEPRRYRSSVSRPLRCRSGPVPLALAREFRATPRRHARALREARGGADPRLSLSFSFSQAEWRGLGVQQSRGWVHYAIHRPEPHIMLYRCVSRPVPRALFSNRRGRGSRPILPPHPAAMRRSTRVARVRDDAVASGARIPRRRRTPRRRRRREGRRRGLGAVARKRPKRNTIGARLTNANATLTSSSPGYTQAHAQLRSARVVGCGQQGERAVSAGRGAWRRALWGTRAFERRRSATIGRDAPERRRRAKLDFEEGG